MCIFVNVYENPFNRLLFRRVYVKIFIAYNNIRQQLSLLCFIPIVIGVFLERKIERSK